MPHLATKSLLFVFGLIALTATARANDARGTLVFEAGGTQRNSMTHWDEYAWPLNAERWGRYHVDVEYYGLRRAMGLNVRLRADGDRNPAKGFVKAGGSRDQPRTERLGTLYISAAGEHELVLLSPQDDPIYDFKLVGIRLVPAPESEDEVTQDSAGNVTLLAKDATTFSKMMRYEPKDVKNCLGFWVDKDDWAQWEFEVTKPGRFAVTVYQGCGKGNHGSTVAVEVGEQTNTFTVRDTGGFQNWKGVEAGEIEITEAGKHTLAVRPQTQKGKAVLDVQKVVLVPVE